MRRAARYSLQQPSGLDAAPQPRALPRDVQAEVEDMTRGPLKTPPGPSKLSCAVAVGRITHGLDSMLETREQNMRDGYLTREAFEATAREIRSARGHATMADCESATGAKRDFYQCMSSNAGHVMACAQQHRF